MTASPANFGKEPLSEAMKPFSGEGSIDHVTRLSNLRKELLQKAHQRIAQLEAELAESQKPLRWTSEVPKVPGWYWWQHPFPRMKGSKIEIRRYYTFQLNGQRCPGEMWSGPLPEPKE